MSELDKYREEINALDDQLMRLFEKRMQVARAVGMYKKQRNLPILNLEREKEVLEKNIAKVTDVTLHGVARKYIQTMMDLSKELQLELIKEDK